LNTAAAQLIALNAGQVVSQSLTEFLRGHQLRAPHASNSMAMPVEAEPSCLNNPGHLANSWLLLPGLALLAIMIEREPDGDCDSDHAAADTGVHAVDRHAHNAESGESEWQDCSIHDTYYLLRLSRSRSLRLYGDTTDGLISAK
jgi:hypothetical protein